MPHRVRPPASNENPRRFVGQEEQRDADAFAAALQPRHPELQSLPPAANSAPGALDALLFRGVLLVAYAAGDEIIIARGTDLSTLRRLRCSKSNGARATCVAFRSTDAALSACFGSHVVVFEGWNQRARETGKLYCSDAVEVDLPNVTAATLSWSSDGTRLAAVGEGVVVWKVLQPDPNRFMNTVFDVEYVSVFRLSTSQAPVPSFSIGSISPDGTHIAASAMYARVGWVWSIPFIMKDEASALSCAEIVYGWSGVAAMDWKPRGGGNPALMTVDRDATVRLWVRVAPSKGDSAPTPSGHLASGPASWMEEVARSPHAERTQRAGAAFLRWGGGGGVADDESDAQATSSSHPFIVTDVAPKPSRCHHWIVRVAAGDAQAWRVRGLDDRPRAEYARLEPGSGDALHGAEDEDGEDGCFKEARRSLSDVIVAATRAVAPIPLTTSSQRNVGLVKSYAISNGERYLRSPEPPEPPSVAAVFMLLVRSGTAAIARYDMCPTSNAPAVCRARAGAGHVSPIASITASQESVSTLETSGWLASRGQAGDVLLWRTDVTAGPREPVSVAARLPGPHTAVAFAPPSLVSSNESISGIFAIDAAFSTLRLFSVFLHPRKRLRSSVQSIESARKVASCHNDEAANPDRGVCQLLVLPHKRISSAVDGVQSCVVFGIGTSGHVRAWHALRSKGNSVKIARAPLEVKGRRLGRATAAGTCVEGGTDHGLLVVGGVDGCMRVYKVTSELEESAFMLENGRTSQQYRDQIVTQLSGCRVFLSEIAFLGERDGSEASVTEVQVTAGGSRIVSTRADSSIVVWERSSSAGAGWTVELSTSASTAVENSDLKNEQSLNSTAIEKPCRLLRKYSFTEAYPISVSTGEDRNGDLYLIAALPGGTFDIYQKAIGAYWEKSHSFTDVTQDSGLPKSHVTHIGPGYVAATSGHALAVYKANFSAKNTMSHATDAAGYSPSRGLMALLLSGGSVSQTIAALGELHDYVKVAAQKVISSSTYKAGRGLIPPPPLLKMLLSMTDSYSSTKKNSYSASGRMDRSSALDFRVPTSPAPVGRSLFAELMAKSEAKMREEGDESLQPRLSSRSSKGKDKDEMLFLADRLRSVSLSGISRSEETVLAAFAKSVSALREILPSLDPSGARFALIAECYRTALPSAQVPSSIVALAVHSSSCDAIMDYFLTPAKSSSPGALLFSQSQANRTEQNKDNAGGMWASARQLGSGWWVSNASGVKKLIERIARSEFNATRNADNAALWYVSLGRNSALAALYKAQQNHRMAKFLLRNFSDPENRTAASKNAYVLVSKHRLLLATAFFILAHDFNGALNLVKTRIKDFQLYIMLARILDNGSHLESSLRNVSMLVQRNGDQHAQALALWLLGDHEKALLVANEEALSSPSQTSEVGRALGEMLPSAVFTLAHVLAMSERPPIRGCNSTIKVVRECRDRAAKALQADGCPVATLKITLDLTKSVLSEATPELQESSESAVRGHSREASKYLSSVQAISAASDAVKGRAIAFAGAVRSGVTRRYLLTLVESDLVELCTGFLGVNRTIEAAVDASAELSRADEVDASVALALAALTLAEEHSEPQQEIFSQAELALESCLRVAVSRALYHVQCAISLLHQPSTSSHLLAELLLKTKTAVAVVEKAQPFVTSIFHQLLLEFKGSVLALRFGVAFLRGDWPDLLAALRYCESIWPPSTLFKQNSAEISQDMDIDDSLSGASSCSHVAADTVSVEALRHMASNPAVLRMSPGLGHLRRRRKAPSMTLIDCIGASAATLGDESGGIPTLSISPNDPFALIHIHPALRCALSAASLAYLSTHLATRASKFARSTSLSRNQDCAHNIWKNETALSGSFRLVDSAEALEHVALDALGGWIPLLHFGSEAERNNMAPPDESAGAFVDLWTTLGCLPEYAPSLSEAATVAAAELAAAASRAAVEAAEIRDGGRRMRKRRERKGEVVANIEKEGLQHFDTTSADSLYGAYPVRFSASAVGPWSGRGRHASLYREHGALFRTLCVSSTDPPAVIVATPKGVQEIVPSSYTTMPAGFRTHYFSRKSRKPRHRDDKRLEALAEDKASAARAEEHEHDRDIVRTFDTGFGEGPYVPLEIHSANGNDTVAGKPKRSSFASTRKAVWRHQVEATALTSHPLRRRFASGGTDGFVRLWDFADPISLAALREEKFGRVSGLNFSAYGSRIMAVYSSGQVAIWDDPDNYRSVDSKVPRRSGQRRAKIITAFDNRSASDGIFLDERNTIAIVGDPVSPPAVGHSLRVFDTREPNSSFTASWSTRVHGHGEARCLTLLEDRMRIATGGLDGTLSVVDLRTKGCVAELPAHSDEVTCIALEQPRGRALVSGSRNGDIKVWDARTLLQLDVLQGAHVPTRHYWSGSGIGGLIGSYGTQALALTDRSLISCGGDGVVKIWGPGWSDYDLKVF